MHTAHMMGTRHVVGLTGLAAHQVHASFVSRSTTKLEKVFDTYCEEKKLKPSEVR